MDPVCATNGGATSGVPDSCQSISKAYSRLSALVQCRKGGGGAIRRDASRNQFRARAPDVFGDAPAAFVVADMGEEVDTAAEPRQPDRHVEWAAADVLAEDLAVALDDVDQGLPDHERAFAAQWTSLRILSHQLLKGRSRAVAVQRVQRPQIGLDEAVG